MHRGSQACRMVRRGPAVALASTGPGRVLSHGAQPPLIHAETFGVHPSSHFLSNGCGSVPERLRLDSTCRGVRPFRVALQWSAVVPVPVSQTPIRSNCPLDDPSQTSAMLPGINNLQSSSFLATIFAYSHRVYYAALSLRLRCRIQGSGHAQNVPLRRPCKERLTDTRPRHLLRWLRASHGVASCTPLRTQSHR